MAAIDLRSAGEGVHCMLNKKSNISCTWSVNDGKKIKDCLTFTTAEEETSRDILDNVSLDTCILLTQDENSPRHLEVKFSVPDDIRITQLSIVSEARVLEVYGKYGEYVDTVDAEFIDDFADMAVYIADVNFHQNLSECSVKFARFKRFNNMWLYSINLTVKILEKPSLSPVDFEQVEKILKASNNEMSDKVKKFSNYLKLYNTVCSGTDLKSINPNIFKKLIKSEFSEINANYNHSYFVNSLTALESEPVSVETDSASFGTDSASVTDIKEDSSQEFDIEEASDRKSDTVGHERIKIIDLEKQVTLKHKDDCFAQNISSHNEMTDSVSQLQNHISELFSQMESRLMKRIDDKFRELETKQNEKLSLILNSLELLTNNIESKGTNY